MILRRPGCASTHRVHELAEPAMERPVAEPRFVDHHPHAAVGGAEELREGAPRTRNAPALAHAAGAIPDQDVTVPLVVINADELVPAVHNSWSLPRHIVPPLRGPRGPLKAEA